MSYRTIGSYREYQEYLRSPEWRELREIVLNLAQNTCERCGRASLNLQVHHVHYDTLFEEDPTTDLEALCHECHKDADEDRQYESALATYVRKKYGWDYAWFETDLISDTVREEFDDWLNYQETQDSY